MRWISRSICILAIGCMSLAFGADDPKQKKSPESTTIEVQFVDGSNLKMNLPESPIEIQTKFGKLSVPLSSIRRIEFGFRYPDGMERKMIEAVERLGDKNFKVRETAANELISNAVYAYPHIKKILQSQDPEVLRRAKELVKQIESQINFEKTTYSTEDIVFTSEFPIRGKIETASLKGKSHYLGEVQIAFSGMRTLQLDKGETLVNLEASKYATKDNHTWMETDIEVAPFMTLNFMATGNVDLMPGQATNFYTGPEGNQNCGVNGNFVCGSLVGKIGEHGKEFYIGSRNVALSKNSGKLYLRVVGMPEAKEANGSYSIAVTSNSSDVFDPNRARSSPRQNTPVPSSMGFPQGFNAAPRGALRK
jgi:hypothetical protein